MKIFANNQVYVQNKDLAYIYRDIKRGINNYLIPSSIIDTVFVNGFLVTENNKYEFVEFSLPEEINFFKECDWIVNYNDFDDMSEEQIINYANQINEQRNKIVQAFNKLSIKEAEEKFEEKRIKTEALRFKRLSVRDVLWHKQGNLKFDLPEGTNIVYLKKEKVFQKLLSRFKKN